MAAAAIAGGVALWALAGSNPYLLPIVATAMAGAAAVALLIPGRPAAAVGVIFLLAMFQLLEIETLFGSMRLEQPAIVALLIATIWHRGALDLPALRPIWLLIASAAIFLGALTLSSLLVAPEPALSLRLVIWSALSMVAGLLAAVLLRGRVRQVFPWLAGTAALLAVIGLLTSLSYVLFGVWSPIVAAGDPGPRVFFPAYEPNLYASLLAFLSPIAIELFRDKPSRRNLVVLALPLLALSLGLTRAAYAGLVIGLVVFFLLHLRLGGFSSSLRRTAGATVVATVIGLGLPALLLNPTYSNLLEPVVAAVDADTSPSPTRPGPAATPRPDPADEKLVDLDTFDYRIKRVQIGLHEWKESPIIGLGAYSYGQRHVDKKDRPEVIAVLPALVLHDAGIAGFAALGVFLAALAILLWRATSDRLRAPPAIALGSALLIMLIGYLATTALHFAATWIIIGAAVAAAWPGRSAESESSAPTEHTS